MKNDLDKIDPVVEEIYKYKHGTKEFEHNRYKVFIERNLFERYDELIYYTELQLDNEIIDLDDDLLHDIKIEIANRNTLEYNGDKKKQLVVAAIVYDRKLIGSISVEKKDDDAEIGYMILNDYSNKGIGTEAVKQICPLARVSVCHLFHIPILCDYP